jgi:hypothetical protein
MPRFYLIDQSLKGVGGHHFTYACDLLAAASDANYDVVLVTHRRFRRCSTIPSHWQVVRVFRHSAYDDVKEAAVFGDAQRACALGTAVPGVDQREAPALRRRHDSFHVALQHMLRRYPPQSGDLALLPTCSLFDVASLTRALARISGSERATWHIQFHNDFVNGAGDQQRIQHRRQCIVDWLRDCLAIVPTHHVRLHTTTDLLTHTYNALEVAPFDTLPHIANAEKGADDRGNAPAPLRVVCLGGSRTEKGLSQLQPIIDATWNDLISTGRIQFLLQSKPARLRRHRPRLALRVGRHDAAQMPRFSDLPSDEHVVFLRHPLSVSDYRSLLHNSDIGLFLYDRRSYQNRCSGVLTELLAAGKVVIVPGGCWLGSQVDGPNDQYRESLAKQLTTVSVVRLLPLTGARVESIGPGEAAATSESRFPQVPIPRHSTVATVRFSTPPLGRGLTKLEVRQLDAKGRSIHQQEHWGLGSTSPTQPLELVYLDPRASRLGCSCHVVGGTGPLRDVLELEFLQQGAQTPARPPRGGPGLSFASVEAVPDMLRDIVRHFEHYQRHADRFAEGWRRTHHPSAAFRQLIDAGSGCRKAA